MKTKILTSLIPCIFIAMLGFSKSVFSQELNLKYVLSKDIKSVNAYSDGFTLKDGILENNLLSLTFLYGGGCKDHSFYLVSDKENKMQDEVKFFIFHNANKDACDALVNKTGIINLSEIEEINYKDQFVSIYDYNTKKKLISLRPTTVDPSLSIENEKEKNDSNPIQTSAKNLKYILNKDLKSVSSFNDGFSIQDATLDGKFVKLTVTYGGGCTNHDFYVVCDTENKKFRDWTLFLFHNSNNDVCQSIVVQDIYIEISQLELKGFDNYLIRIQDFETKKDLIKVAYGEDESLEGDSKSIGKTKIDKESLIGKNWYSNSFLRFTAIDRVELVAKDRQELGFNGYLTKFDKNNRFVCSYIAQCGNDCFSSYYGRYEIISENRIAIMPDSIRFFQKEYCNNAKDENYTGVKFLCDISFEDGNKMIFKTNANLGMGEKTTEKEYEILVNENFTIELESNKSTGYSWQWTNKSSDNCIEASKWDYVDGKTDGSSNKGVPGKEVISFKGIKSGTATITLEYCRKSVKNSTIETKTIVVKVKDNKKEYEIAVNENFTIELESNKSTGYSWQWTNKSSDNCIEALKWDYVDGKTDGSSNKGVPGKEVISFKGIKPGTATITLEYCRKSVKNSTIETKTVIVKVVDKVKDTGNNEIGIKGGNDIFEKLTKNTWIEKEESMGSCFVFVMSENGKMKALRQIYGSGLPVIATYVYDVEIKNNNVILHYSNNMNNGIDNVKAQDEILVFNKHLELIRNGKSMSNNDAKTILTLWNEQKNELVYIDYRKYESLAINDNEIVIESEKYFLNRR
ncbi:MAG: protease inhibitor I42 family protein [Bacteroidales bacterium]|nr:protease inhibitor I42 family protein [Bacteroidales bacterium]